MAQCGSTAGLTCLPYALYECWRSNVILECILVLKPSPAAQRIASLLRGMTERESIEIAIGV
jgi:hypothetical protein